MVLFKLKIKKFGVALALVAALSSSCRKELPKEEYQNLQPYISKVEAGLKKGEPDKQAIQQLMRALYTLRKDGYKIENADLPKDFDKVIDSLVSFYDYIEGIESGNFYGTGTDGFYYGAMACLKKIKRYSGFVPEDEKQLLVDDTQRYIKYLSERIVASKEYVESKTYRRSRYNPSKHSRHDDYLMEEDAIKRYEEILDEFTSFLRELQNL